MADSLDWHRVVTCFDSARKSAKLSFDCCWDMITQHIESLLHGFSIGAQQVDLRKVPAANAAMQHLPASCLLSLSKVEVYYNVK